MTGEKKEHMEPNITLRDATETDLPQIKNLLVDSWVEHARNAPEMLDESTMRTTEAAYFEEYYRKALGNPDSSVRIAEADGQFAGVIRVDIKEVEPFWKHTKIAWIDDVAVVKRFERKKIAHTLVGEAKKFAIKNNVAQIQARVYSFNHPMRKVFENQGFNSPCALMTWTRK